MHTVILYESQLQGPVRMKVLAATIDIFTGCRFGNDGTQLST